MINNPIITAIHEAIEPLQSWGADIVKLLACILVIECMTLILLTGKELIELKKELSVKRKKINKSKKKNKVTK